MHSNNDTFHIGNGTAGTCSHQPQTVAHGSNSPNEMVKAMYTTVSANFGTIKLMNLMVLLVFAKSLLAQKKQVSL